ncbi:hypothetical protein RhiirA1_474812 [Rhizophagus irregularis]|uniref:DUF659 domain-containing protein n=1 Tax=Rhizophagus irregularis TaxID=588596 RepID=A0A2N0QXY1_9GLOM|nr:hypothetical protein RhiirA1_474812 [Rhizophagus irregularis]
MPRGGRPRHILSTYVTILKKTNSGDKDRQCICNCCAEVLKDDAKPIVNRKERIKKHLTNCKYFWDKYKGEAEEILGNCDVDEEMPPSKHIRIDDDSASISSFRTNSTSSSFNLSRRSSESYYQSSISKFAVRDLNKSEIPKFHDLLIRMTVSNGWSFQWVNNPSTHAFFHWLNPKLKLPDRKQLAGPILDQAIKGIEQLRKEKLNQVHEQAGITLSFDGWKNIVNQELLGIMIILPSGETLIWKAVDISDQRGRAIDVIPKIEEILNDLKDQSIKVAALVSDSAAAYASARRQLRLKYPQYVFLPCFAHQCNLAVGEIFKESSILKNASTNAVKLVNYFNHPNNVPGDTRWNSYYECYLSLIRTKQALRNLVTRYEPPKETSSRSTELYLPTDICQIIIGDLFWSRISQLATLMKPYCGAFDKLQIDKARLHDQVKKPQQFGDDVLAYWYYCSTMCKELGFIATKIFSICHERVVNIAPPIIESGEQETEEEKAQNLDITEELLNCSDNDLLNSYIHPAINAVAKDTPTPNPVLTSHELPDVVMTSVNQPVTSKILRKEEINESTRATDDKQVIKQSTSKGKNYQKKKSPANNLSIPAVIEDMKYQVQKNRSISVI